MLNFLRDAPRYLFFTGKGGVGKTSLACATAVGLAEGGQRVLLISTDPASNLDEVLATPLSSAPTAVAHVSGLFALNINPIVAAAEYRERMVGPYRGLLPEAAIQQMEEQLSGACTVEIAGFNEFAKMLGSDDAERDYDHIVLDTAPTGHTLRLLSLPAAWNSFMASNQTGSSCLGPVSGMAEQQALFVQVVAALKDAVQTRLVLVSRAESMALGEAARASGELREVGLHNQHLIINGLFTSDFGDAIADAFAGKSAAALAAMPSELSDLPRATVDFRPSGVMGLAALRAVGRGEAELMALPETDRTDSGELVDRSLSWPAFMAGLSSEGQGVIMTMGKGGVGKTTMAALIAMELAEQGHSVLLSTTDPAAHVAQAIGHGVKNLRVERIDPAVETARYVDAVLLDNRDRLAATDMALLEEEMHSPCVEEIAVFHAFANTVARGGEQFVVLDTAPTGHTLLLLDATQSYHREVARTASELPPAVEALVPRLRDPLFTRVLVVALPEATPTHEAAALQEDLRRADIEPYGWLVNRSFALSGTKDPVLLAKGSDESAYLEEIVERQARRAVLFPWVAGELDGPDGLKTLVVRPADGSVAERSS